jgi:outer membrane protein OmpA-like peptidoglycan-associated protein
MPLGDRQWQPSHSLYPTLFRCGSTACAVGACNHERETKLHRAAARTSAPTAIPRIVADVLGTPGRPLEPSTRFAMERAFERDFTRVRIHNDQQAALSAEAVDALAYTVGHHLVFGTGQYAPESMVGRRLLAHELAHTLQSTPGAATDVTVHNRAAISENGDQEEIEANFIAARAIAEMPSPPNLAPPTSRQIVHRAPCPQPPTHLGDVPASPSCDSPTVSVIGERLQFCVDSDELTPAGEAELTALLPGLRLRTTVEVHGFASVEGPAHREVAYNLELSCHRANRVHDLLVAGGIPASRIHTFAHGGTSEFGTAANNRAVVIPAHRLTPDLERFRFRVAALSFLACAPCNPFTDDGPLAFSPPASEPAVGTSYRMKHWMEVEVATADHLTFDPSGPGVIDSGHEPGESGYCGTTTKAHILKSVGPTGPVGASSTHGESMEWESEFITQVGAVVPCTLPDAPCGALGPNTAIPPIHNRFVLRIFADGTKESAFVSASTMPMHYLYEDHSIKMFGGAPVHPALDFPAWATSTGVSLNEAEIGFKALRVACCNGGLLPGCICSCNGGKTDVFTGVPDGESNFLACVGVAGALAVRSCPTPCAAAGTACALPALSSNP